MSLSCEPIAPFKIYNQTDEVLTIYITGYKIGDVQPKEEIENDYLPMYQVENGQYHIEAINEQDDIVYSKIFTYEESRDMDWKITIFRSSDNCTLNE